MSISFEGRSISAALIFLLLWLNLSVGFVSAAGGDETPAVAAPALAAPAPAAPLPPFRNVSLPWQDRADDLVGRLTLEELVQQLAKGGIGPFGGPAPAIPRLGVEPYQWNTECLRGAVRSGPATSFPQAIGLAATFDAELLAAIGRATGLEVRAKHNDFVARGDYADHTGLTCFAPVINIARHPLWGRNQETYGEDPHLSGLLGAAYVRGLQGNATDRYLLTGAGCKHFAAYDGPDSYPESRFGFDARVSRQDLEQTFLPQFQRCIEAGSVSVMCSYNSINGVPACANSDLLRGILRDRWNFTGYVVSDAGALEFAILFHRYFPDRLSAAIGSLKAGVNLELSACPYESCIVFEQLTAAAAAGSVSEADLRSAVWPLFLTRLRLGEFDPASMNPYAGLTPAQFVQSPEHRQLSLTAAEASLVLLKNAANFLPDGLLKPGLRLGVVGPVSDDMSLVYGDYTADRMSQYERPLLAALRERFGGGSESVQHVTYCLEGGVYCTRQDPGALTGLLASTDVVLAVLGTSTHIEAESLDRRELALPEGQRLLMQQLAASGRPVILAVVSGSPVGLDLAANSAAVRAIVWCGYPAQNFGLALANLLSGQYSPYAALPFTWPSERNALSSITDYDMSNQTYRFAPSRPDDPQSQPLFHFGQGLSYCRVGLSNLTTSPSSYLPVGQELRISLRVTANSSRPDCTLVLKAYLVPPTTVGRNPRVWLAGIRKVSLRGGGGGSSFDLALQARDMQLWDGDAGLMRQLPGTYQVVVGDYFDRQCADCRVQASFNIVD